MISSKLSLLLRNSNVSSLSIRIARSSYSVTQCADELYFDVRRKKLQRATLLSISENLLVNIKMKTNIDWNLIKDEVIRSHPVFFSRYNFEVQFMQYLTHVEENDKNLLQSFADHVEQLLTETPNKVIKAHYIVYLTNRFDSLDPKKIKHMLEDLVSDKKFSKFPAVFNAYIGYAKLSPEACRETLEFLDEDSLRKSNIDKLVEACLRHNFFREGYDLLLNYRDSISSSLLDLLFNSVYQNLDKYTSFIKLLHSKRMIIDSELEYTFLDFFKNLGASFQLTTIDPKSTKCSHCGSKLDTFTVEESELLRVYVKDNLLIKDGNPYMKSTPDELNNFLKLMEQTREPFDLVIDALNCSFWAAVRMLQQEKESQKIVVANLGLKENLYNLLESTGVLEKFHKIFVIGRKHMKDWKSIESLRKLGDRVEIFLLKNTSDDDLFILYSALLHPKTHVLTMDYFRQHAKYLDARTYPIFQKWTDCRVVRFKKKKDSVLVLPPGVNCVPQINDNGIVHFPVCKVYDNDRISVQRWYCCSVNR